MSLIFLLVDLLLLSSYSFSSSIIIRSLLAYAITESRSPKILNYGSSIYVRKLSLMIFSLFLSLKKVLFVLFKQLSNLLAAILDLSTVYSFKVDSMAVCNFAQLLYWFFVIGLCFSLETGYVLLLLLSDTDVSLFDRF